MDLVREAVAVAAQGVSALERAEAKELISRSGPELVRGCSPKYPMGALTRERN